ncbi:hypothetical protein FOZ60_011320 [Perkinsus olseni]|uniref:Small ribosomal subunit protein mS23 n=2 Tax=Perkinsus olseni TaxID=32597 RepID=A0A7J6PCY1_PEROL|nr:hypothetical protein FOZ60_011320 [Perkinsus olseni]
MTYGHIHPYGTNFYRGYKLDIVGRIRRLAEAGMLTQRPPWMQSAERVPPMENLNINFQTRKVKNPYPKLVKFLLRKYPDLRFQDCFVEGNQWTRGNDTYRDDHPVMQFVARQLQLMNNGMDRRRAFKQAEEEFRERRKKLEEQQKIEMAMAWNSAVMPAFGSNRRPNPLYPNGLAYSRQREAELRELHLRRILSRVRSFRFGKLKQEYRDAGREEEIPTLMKMPRRLEVEQERAALVGKLRPSKYRRWGGTESTMSPRQQRRHTAALEAAEMLDPIHDADDEFDADDEADLLEEDDEVLLGEDAVEGATQMAEAIAFDESKYSAAPLRKSKVAASLKELLEDNEESIPSLSTLREMYGVGKSNPFVGNPFEGNKPDSDKPEQWEVEDFEREMSDQVIGKPTMKPKYGNRKGPRPY